MGRDKRFLKLSETQLSLQLEIPQNYLFDNDAVSKLFENLELNISHENITHKSSSVDYAVSNYFFTKVTYDDSYCSSTMDTNAIFDHA